MKHHTPAPVKEEEEIIDPVTIQFDGVLTSLTTFRSQITALQQQLRGLEKTVRREMKGLRKEAVKNKHKGNQQAFGICEADTDFR